MALSETDAPPVVRRWLRLPARPPRVDVALAVAFVVTTLAEVLLSPAVTSPVEHAVVGSLAMALLAWRRTAPLLLATLVVATNPAGEFSTLLSLVLVCFTIGSETGPPRSYVGLLPVPRP